MTAGLEPVTPGEILLEEFMKPMGISQNKLARDIDVPIARINDIVHGRRGITADTAMRLDPVDRVVRSHRVIGPDQLAGVGDPGFEHAAR